MSQASPSATVSGIPATHIDKLNAYLKQTVDDGYFAGVTSAVMQHGQVLQNETFGFRDVEKRQPMTTDTLFRIASSTKPIVGVAMMMLYEEGKWKLTDKLADHIPQFKNLKVRGKDGTLQAPVQPQTMAHIMSHSAGFGGAQLVARTSEPDAPPVLRERPGDLAAMIERMATEPLGFHPGKRFLYGPSVDVQGYLVEKFSGMRLDNFLKARLWEPLGMKDTDFCVHEDAVDRISSMYKYENGKLERLGKADPERLTRRPTFLSGSGGLWSTPEDYRRFCEMLLEEGSYQGARILKPETVRLMRQDCLEPQVFVRVTAGYTMPGARFGCDFMVTTEPQGDSAMYGKDSYSWGGAFGTYFWIDPTNDLAVSGMVQIQNGGAQHLGMKTEYPDLKKGSAQLLYWGEKRL